MKRPHPRGFTLIELLVVVAIIAVLIAILLPSLGRAKTTALRTRCAATMKSWGTATYTYMQEFSGWFGSKPAGGYFGSQWDQDPKAYGIPEGQSVVDPLNPTAAPQRVGAAIYGNQMGNVTGTKSRFCPADTGTANMGQNGIFYYGNRPLAGYRYVCYMNRGPSGLTGRPSQVQRFSQFKNHSNVAVMADAASASNYGDTFAVITHNGGPGPSTGTLYTGLTNNSPNPPRLAWNSEKELLERHKGYGGVLFLDGHVDIVPYTEYLKNIPATVNDPDGSKKWTQFSQ